MVTKRLSRLTPVPSKHLLPLLRNTLHTSSGHCRLCSSGLSSINRGSDLTKRQGWLLLFFFNPACVFVQVAPSYAVFVAFCSQERVAYNAFVLTTVGALAFGGIWSGLSLSLAFLTIWAPFSSSLQSNPIAAYSLAIATNHAMVFQQLIFLADAVTMFLMTPGVEARDAWMCSWGVGYVNYKIFGSTLFAFVNICGSGGSWQRLIVPVVWLCVDGPLLVGLLTTCGEYGVSYWILAAQWPVAVSSAAMYLAPWMIRQLI